MKLYKTTFGNIVFKNDNYYAINRLSWDELLNQKNLFEAINNEISESKADDSLKVYIENNILPPINTQEIWAAGVTYLRSKKARMDESKDAGGGDFYDRVYEAERPEIFFKATAARTVGHLEKIRIRKDSKWNVPEPELTLFINKFGQISGYTIGNDVSSRDIEGENPLYLPQAKSYDKSAAIGPCILILENDLDRNTVISLQIIRNEIEVFSQSTQINQMKRGFIELVEFLTRECTFPTGCFLMTGTGIVPPDEFSLIKNDVVKITIGQIGTLINTVE
jgi:2-dehydro-3-deoxy-D-arabinonate dehydratase